MSKNDNALVLTTYAINQAKIVGSSNAAFLNSSTFTSTTNKNDVSRYYSHFKQSTLTPSKEQIMSPVEASTRTNGQRTLINDDDFPVSNTLPCVANCQGSYGRLWHICN